jgi:hypothetical protein
MGKIRCALQPSSMTLDRDRPEILTPPRHPQACCTRQAITIPAGVLAKTAQKHDYPSAAWRRSCARRSGTRRPARRGDRPRHPIGRTARRVVTAASVTGCLPCRRLPDGVRVTGEMSCSEIALTNMAIWLDGNPVPGSG